MRKKEKIVISLIIIILMLLSLTQNVYANSISDSIENIEYSNEFKEWLKLTEEEKNNSIMPRMYDIRYKRELKSNLIYKAKMLGVSNEASFNLKSIIPENLVIRNQMSTQSCWAFASISSLETNLALNNYKTNQNTSKVYDYSERHMEYSTSRTFKNNQINSDGYNREVGTGGNWYFAETYLTKGLGAIPESEMPFEDNEDKIDLSSIQNKTVSTQVYDTVEFPDYSELSGESKESVMNQIKYHIKNYGSVSGIIHGNSSVFYNYSCYNNTTGALYCNDSSTHVANHGISIVGWDDNYSKENFSEDCRPSSNGAWIARNSWGVEQVWGVNILKQKIFDSFKSECISNGWNSASEIPNSVLENLGFTIDGANAVASNGDNGFIYVSYEDCNISKMLSGIEKATDTVNYDYIYQYDEYYPCYLINYNQSKVKLCNIFDKQTTGTEYLTQVSLHSPGQYKCRVYVNPNGDGRSKNEMKAVQLKTGEYETIGTGYHTLEFSKPIEIKGSKFAVVVEIEDLQNEGTTILLEAKVPELETLNYVSTETGKCLIAGEYEFDNCVWEDLGKLHEKNSRHLNADSTIKAFTVTELNDGSLKNIEIVTPPNKVDYYEGDNFNGEGMVIKANFNSKTQPYTILDSSSYTIENGTNLKANQNSVIISFEDESVEQPINVEKNTVTSIRVKNPPKKTEYIEGQNFDASEMVIEATYKNGTVKNVSNYKIENGKNLKYNQNYVTISFDEKTVNQSISVIKNELEKIEIIQAPNKTKYVAGQNFNKNGMKVIGYYKNGNNLEITDYTIENGTNLSKDQTSITVKYEGKTAKQNIEVEEKVIQEIKIDKLPSKTKYVQNNENIDLNGGTIKVIYNDGSQEIIELNSDMVKVSGFSNKNIGKNTITVEYQNKTTSFDVTIVEEEKPVNSNFEKAELKINEVKLYYYVNLAKENHVTLKTKISKIELNDVNDSVDYYYYMSTNPNDTNITKWIKIKDVNASNDSIEFIIDTSEIPYIDEISGSENIVYIYIKEIAKKGNKESTIISKSMKMNCDVEEELYVDDKKISSEGNTNNTTEVDDNTKVDTNKNEQGNTQNYNTGVQNNNSNSNEQKDQTTATGILPNTGLKSILVVIVAITIVGVIKYIKYRDLKNDLK